MCFYSIICYIIVFSVICFIYHIIYIAYYTYCSYGIFTYNLHVLYIWSHIMAAGVTHLADLFCTNICAIPLCNSLLSFLFYGIQIVLYLFSHLSACLRAAVTCEFPSGINKVLSYLTLDLYVSFVLKHSKELISGDDLEII